jgi:hypothetical protein
MLIPTCVFMYQHIIESVAEGNLTEDVVFAVDAIAPPAARSNRARKSQLQNMIL